VRFHDFHLESYTVSRFGADITLHLVYDDADQRRETSVIRFSDVEAYHFVHTGGAIITDIAVIPVAELLGRVGDQLAEWQRLHGGYSHWRDTPSAYAAALHQQGYRAWTIDSAIGFAGFVIGRAAEEVEREVDAKA
jgi:hypothetical protein